MAQSFSAQVRGWTKKAERNAGLVVADAAQGVFEDMTQRQPSVKETGGTFELGKVPVDEGVLIGSQVTFLNDQAAGAGEASYTAAIASFELGDTIEHGFTAEYAPRIEHGFVGVDAAGRTYNQPGRFMVREAINGQGGWQARVDASAARFED